MTTTVAGEGRVLTALRVLAWGGAAALLAAPAVAMRFTSEVQWSAGDFIAAGLMLGVPLAILETTVRASRSWFYRGGVAVAVGTAFLITWSNLAVGILGDEGEPINQIFFGVLLVAMLGSFAAAFKARGMAPAMLATALTQAATAAVALAGGHFEVIIIAGFAAMWLLSAWLFLQAAKRQATAARA